MIPWGNFMKVTESKTIEQLIAHVNEVYFKVKELKRFNILISESAEISFNFPDYIKEEINKLGFFEKPSFQSKVALALACTEEDRNNYLEDSEIEFINKFFSLKVDRELITKMHSKYI